ncbi:MULTISPECIES: hypothetical protein [unclassified Luteimonas]
MSKLLIWDLDDTLWQGTLAEGDVPILHQSRIDAIRQLNGAGVVHSICSKNDRQTAKFELERFGLWNEFVFPEISFEPKGELVKRIISDMQLRAPDVVFIDDNEMNLREVEFVNPGIRTIDARGDAADVFLAELLEKTKGISKSRIPEYRILEQKRADRETGQSSNEEFLRSCDIAVALVRRTDNLRYAGRIEELINRTNQLNFTKSRVEPGSMPEYIIDVARNETYSVFVWDRYGYYGLVGFAAVENKTVLRHFLFSCRTMNMGVENALASVLKKTFKSVTPPVEATKPDWIRLVQPDSEEFAQRTGAESEAGTPTIRVMANCQSGAIAHYMGGQDVEFDNWPRTFKLEDALGPGLGESPQPLLIYGAFFDYDTRYWSKPPSDAVYRSAVERLIVLSKETGSRLIVILPKPEFSQERAVDGITCERFARLNAIWSELSGPAGHVELVRLGVDVPLGDVVDPRHFDRTTLKLLGELMRERAGDCRGGR